jgi:hypothetical protein
VVATAMGTQYETAPKDHRDDEHNGGEHDEERCEPEDSAAPMRLVPLPIPARGWFGSCGWFAPTFRRFSHAAIIARHAVSSLRIWNGRRTSRLARSGRVRWSHHEPLLRVEDTRQLDASQQILRLC